MVRGVLIVIATTVVLLSVVVGAVAVGLHRIAAAQREADRAWQAPKPAAPTTAAATYPAEADDSQHAPPVSTSLVLWAKDANVHGSVHLTDTKVYRNHASDAAEEQRIEKRRRLAGVQVTGYLAGWKTAEDIAEWPIEVPKAGAYEIDVTYACPKYGEGAEFLIRVADKDLPFRSEGNRETTSFRVVTLGTMDLPAGKATLSVRPAGKLAGSKTLLNLRSVQVIPAS